ncbi:MAG: N-acetyltransferase [Ignavibacteriae bacterium]|nr:MAG: N-acetyltransferase [Ignavibacteriota bacterium]
MEIVIKDIPADKINDAISIFAEAFFDDPLFVFAFSEDEIRKRQTRIMYEFVVNDMVPKLNLTLKGAFANNELAGVTIYTTPDSYEWGEQMIESITKMREKANDSRMNYIGEFARLGGYEPDGEYLYGNELAVSKNFRKHGIGRTLNKFLINECNKFPEAQGILIDTANENNVKLYEKWGWELKAAVDFYQIKKYFLWKDKI